MPKTVIELVQVPGNYYESKKTQLLPGDYSGQLVFKQEIIPIKVINISELPQQIFDIQTLDNNINPGDNQATDGINIGPHPQRRVPTVLYRYAKHIGSISMTHHTHPYLSLT